MLLSSGSMRIPEVVFVTTAVFASSIVIRAPIIGPPETTKYLDFSVPPAISIQVSKDVPTGTWSTVGFFTSPVTVKSVSYTHLDVYKRQHLEYLHRLYHFLR